LGGLLSDRRQYVTRASQRARSEGAACLGRFLLRGQVLVEFVQRALSDRPYLDRWAALRRIGVQVAREFVRDLGEVVRWVWRAAGVAVVFMRRVWARVCRESWRWGLDRSRQSVPAVRLYYGSAVILLGIAVGYAVVYLTY
jgi:hypothetical protein